MFKELIKILTPSFNFILVVFFILLIYIFYKYKNIYEFFFNNPLGYISILFIIGFSYYLNKWLGILIGFSLGLLYILSRPINFFTENTKEGFTWSKETIHKFDKYEDTYNPNIVFDIDILQKQASQKEVDILFETGMWPWSEETQNLFKENVQNNTMIKTSPEGAVELARTIYNENIAKQMLSWNAKEGQFLLSGVFVDSKENHEENLSGSGTYGFKSGLISPNKDLIKCGTNKKNELVIQRTKNEGNDGIYGAHVKVVEDLNYKDLPNIIKGFKFIKSACNPCVAIKEIPEYTCPFTLDGDVDKISSIWKNLWGINNSAPSNVGDEKKIDKKEFPLYKDVKNHK